jgi:hypothetical protein
LVADITQNSAESGAEVVELEIRETAEPGEAKRGAGKAEFRFITRDNGKGMTGAGLKRAVDPFVTDGIKHPGRRVGLGIPFLIQTASQSGGGWKITSTQAGQTSIQGSETGELECFEPKSESGTVVEAWFNLTNVDTPPVGDIPGLFRSVLLFNGPKEVILKRERTGGEEGLDYKVTKSELEEALGGLEDVSSLALLGKYLRSLEEKDT